ncbi:helix-turn-helix domain-containing protein [Nocardia takedensis]|uniref:helix-turn-helix domain-containing protein n=1 Tax=Nocardia takedensis TaxID=259390 RepID=UPI0002D87AF8|nr:helix-turn-helix transcriptional regulator [Nocardia takedensis]
MFWDDLAEDLKDPEFLREYVLNSIRVQTIDSIVGALDQARAEADLSKAALARAVALEPSVVRRLFSAESNPTLRTVSDLAAALGMRVALVPLDGAESDVVATALRTGTTEDLASLAGAVRCYTAPARAS